jgi:deoxyribodipyrimidine photo-lyase
MNNLFIFTNDLRLVDNLALYEASKNSISLEVIYLFNPKKWNQHNDSPLKIKFQLENLAILKEGLNKLNINLKILHANGVEDESIKILEEAVSIKASGVYINKDYGINERRRDADLEKKLTDKGIKFFSYDSSIIDPELIKTGSDTFFKVFTPYSKAFRSLLSENHLKLVPEPVMQSKVLQDSDPIPDFELKNDLHKKAINLYQPGENSALILLENFIEDKINKYKTLRDFPKLDSTSRLSPYFASGVISAKSCINLLSKFSEDIPGTGHYSWFNEVIWREFYKYIIYHYPRVSMKKSFNEKYDALIWRDDEGSFNAWCNGATGIPLIDAAMTQLNQTGWMHNRLRMVVAMFLSKNLLIDWKKGEEYFMRNLIDGDHASNVGGWQWSASTGVDAAPYFRIFNPITQSEKFDKEGEFIKKYLPIFSELSPKEIHNPDSETRTKLKYPKMIVDLSSSRKRAIETFSKI